MVWHHLRFNTAINERTDRPSVDNAHHIAIVYDLVWERRRRHRVPAACLMKNVPFRLAVVNIRKRAHKPHTYHDDA